MLDFMDAHTLTTTFAEVVCPICLGSLSTRENLDLLICVRCASVFSVASGLPIVLIDDENRRIKADEIKGEVEFNVKKIPAEVHQTRNAFVDRNTELFLKAADVSLQDKEVLAVGCSMAELLLCVRHGGRPVGLDLVPKLTLACYRATTELGLDARWVCGDGECLPFSSETFDLVIVRQALHHMVKYYSAIAEFFRVTRIGGAVLIVDEPFCPASPFDAVLESSPACQLYGDVRVADLRTSFGLPPARSGSPPMSDPESLDTQREYIAVDGADPEQLLADKYHSFSLPNCIAALQQHTREYLLHWPAEVAWTEESEGIVAFRHGLNRVCDLPILARLTSIGNVSIASKKTGPTTVFRNRRGIRPIPLDSVASMLA